MSADDPDKLLDSVWRQRAEQIEAKRVVLERRLRHAQSLRDGL